MTYPSGGWAFAWGNANADPCGDMLKSSPGGTIARAGLYSISGPNNVVYRCNTGIGTGKGSGEQILNQAYKDSQGKKSCTFTVAPKELPIFDAAFPLTAKYSWGRGFSFARGYKVKANTGDEVDEVNYKGDATKYGNSHDGFDVNMPEGTELRAMADGVVLLSRARDITKYLPKCPKGSTTPQNELYVLHVVGKGAYRELFVSYYAHLKSYEVNAGNKVTRGQKLGISGNTGCSGGPHLHLGVSRFSNTATRYRRDFTIPATEDYDKDTVTDAFGFSWGAKAGFDPWAWRAISSGRGALSINLWRPNQEFKRD
jgi:murein DD-endopeptidase MepM/ murein hydrolase activator NlpD